MPYEIIIQCLRFAVKNKSGISQHEIFHKFSFNYAFKPLKLLEFVEIAART